MTVGIWVLGDQLWQGQAAIASQTTSAPTSPTSPDISPQTAPSSTCKIILIESTAWSQRRPYHYQKLVLVWSAMRHFAAELEAAGWSVIYRRGQTFETELNRVIENEGITELRVMEPSDRPFRQAIERLQLPCPIHWYPNNHFLWSAAEFSAWAAPYKQLRMENFYRAGRKRFDILMEQDKPVGGQWNFDKQNRKPPKAGMKPPKPLRFQPDDITQSVIRDIHNEALPGFGEMEPFHWAVTRTEAQAVLDNFITVRLKTFGPFQDAMVTGEDTMWHGLLSPYLNLGLLQPLEVIQAVEQAYYDRDLDLASVEGFIRQVLGWREYMHGLYHDFDPEYGQQNWFEHAQPLPSFFWDGNTDMNCLKQSLDQTLRTGYAHHIQRLMILANFALIAGLNPQETESWFHSAFIDAYDWVMQTNVIGMGLFADGGKLASKPYAASANYINKMSDYCKGCRYKPKEKLGGQACPFNYFYWDFLARHRDRLKSQGRMNLILSQLDRMDPEVLGQMRHQAEHWHQVQSHSQI